jgi:type II secretory pathway component PulM
MRISRWLLERYKRLDRRERIVVAAGAVISVVALSVAYLLLPFARNWTEREEAIEAKMEQVARLQALLENREALQEAVDGLEQSRDRRARRLLTGSTAALAASSVQSLMRSYAERSRVRLERVTVDPDQTPEEDGLTPIRLQLTVRGDVYGMVDFLFYLQSGETLLVIDELQITGSSGGINRSGAELLGWTVHLHGLYAPDEVAA